ncbi:SDR family NAD(P)-dependent oxidoreductase [Alkalihalophilus marmarensis]|uniref:SDR family NAD(P)-dependent oxidoreductase n=1 Tax=Alkalihalophilus marmarensis TaxID=521377 RepID=UPI002E20DDAD|nr:SDR family oxidoreductase [Alkalihalophilus marmarensis]
MRNEVVIVTGAGQGIGKVIALEYIKRGATVIACDLNQEAVEKTAREIDEKDKHLYYPMACDVRSEDQIQELIGHVKQQFERIDVLINNAGVSSFKSPFELDVSEWDDVIHTNLRSVFIFTKEAAKVMQETQYGAIVNIASTRAMMSEPNSEAYAASKGGIISLTHAFAASLQDSGVRVNAISPGWIHTGDAGDLREVDHKQHFSKRVGVPEDIARACLFLTQKENSFITGENIVIDGGMTRKMIYEH